MHDEEDLLHHVVDRSVVHAEAARAPPHEVESTLVDLLEGQGRRLDGRGGGRGRGRARAHAGPVGAGEPRHRPGERRERHHAG